jgi:acyl carrier protein
MTMDERAIREAVIAILRGIAPEFDPNELEEATALRDQIDLDSVDWLNVLVAINEKLKVDIPESDYEKLRSLADLVSYLASRMR